MAQNCLICGNLIDGDEAFYQHHLNQCLDGSNKLAAADAGASVLAAHAPAQASADHPRANGTAHAQPNSNGTPQPQPGPSRPTNGQPHLSFHWVGHDKGKHQIDGSKGLVPVIGKLLEKSHAAGKTRVGYLCDPAVEHVARGLIDITWGCGYRNAQMLFSALRALECYAAIHPTATGPAMPVPTILELQTIIEHAWAAGHDPDGAKHFKHKLRKSIKWVGTTEIYTAFTWLGIRAKIVDFPKPVPGLGSGRPAHDLLVDWLKTYFDTGPPSPSSPHSTSPTSPSTPAKRHSDALAALSPSPIHRTPRQPVYLQHNGHSRTVIGIESGPTGDWLLLFDPGKNVDPKLRKAGEAAAAAGVGAGAGGRAKRAKSATPPTPGSSLGSAGMEGVAEVPKRRGFGAGRSKVGGGEEDGLVGERYAKLLDPFRVNLKKLSRHDEYQIMYVEDGPILTAEEKAARRMVKSVAVR